MFSDHEGIQQRTQERSSGQEEQKQSEVGLGPGLRNCLLITKADKDRLCLQMNQEHSVIVNIFSCVLSFVLS